MNLAPVPSDKGHTLVPGSQAAGGLPTLIATHGHCCTVCLPCVSLPSPCAAHNADQATVSVRGMRYTYGIPHASARTQIATLQRSMSRRELITQTTFYTGVTRSPRDGVIAV